MAFARQRLISAPIVGKVVERLGKIWEKHSGVMMKGALVSPTNDDDDDDSNWRREGGEGDGLRGS